MESGHAPRRGLPPNGARSVKAAFAFPIVWGVTQALAMFFLLRVLEWRFFLSAVIAVTVAGGVAEFARRWVERVSSTR